MGFGSNSVRSFSQIDAVARDVLLQPTTRKDCDNLSAAPPPISLPSSFMSFSSLAPHNVTAGRPRGSGRPVGVTCPFCVKWCPCKAEMDRHVRTHTGERPYKCHLCSYSATVKCTLKNHLRAIHDRPEKI